MPEASLDDLKNTYVAVAQGLEALKSGLFYGANAEVIVNLKRYLGESQAYLHGEIERRGGENGSSTSEAKAQENHEPAPSSANIDA